MDGPRVVITGLGCVTPCGVGAPQFWENIVSGRSGVSTLGRFDPAGHKSKVSGEVRDFEPGDFLRRRETAGSARVVQFGLSSARMALESAGLVVEDIDSTRIGVFVGTSIGTFEYAEDAHSVFLEKGVQRVHPLFPAQSYPGVVATQIAISLGVRGPAMCITTACTSAADAIGIAAMHLRAGLIDYAVVGGTEAPITPLLFASFDRLGALSTAFNRDPEHSSRPFAADRDGFVMAEGAGMLILESESAAAARGAIPLAVLAGYGATSDAHNIISAEPGGVQGIRAVQIALDAAGLAMSEIDYISAHAIGAMGDATELEILAALLADGAVRTPITALKSLTGHVMGAAPALELIAAVQAIHKKRLPATLNLAPDSTPFDVVCGAARAVGPLRILSPTFGFGSRNAALVITNE